MSARSGKSGSNSRCGSPSGGGGGGAGYGAPPMPAISSYGSVYDGPGNIPLMGPGPPPPRPPATAPPPPPMIGVEGGAPAGPAPYAGLDKQASRKVLNMPPYSSLNNKREAPAYEELINFPRAKDKDEMRCVMCGLPPSEQCVIPRQNKDVCKECDKSTWLHIASDVYFKWCKGCKKFLKLGSFSQKLDAAKCDKCRERGRQSYLQKKGKDADEGTLLGLPHRHHHHAGPPHMPPPHLFPPPPGVGFPPHHMPPPPHMAGRGPPPGPFIGLPPPPPGLIPPPHGSGRGGGGRGSYRELEGEDLIGEGSSGEEEHGGHPAHHLPPPPPPHIMGPPGHHGHGHPGLLPVPPPPSISAALGGEHGGASGSSSVAGSEAEREELSAGGQASRTEEGEEGTEEGEEEGEDMLSKLKRGGAPVPMGQEAGAMAQPGTPTGASTQAMPGGSPFPTTPGGTVVGGAGATTLSSLIGATEASGNNLMELARIHQQIVDLEAQAEQVSALSAQLEAERRRNRHLQGHVEQLNEELEKARREADALKQQLEEWYAREAALRAAEGLGPAVYGEEGKDKRNRSDSVAGAAALLGGFKKQKVSASGGAGGEGLSVATEGAGAGAEGEEAPQTAEQPVSAPAGEGGKGEAFGVGYETPRANAIKGAPIAL